MRRAAALLAFGVLFPLRATAQAGGTPARVEGVVWDSLGGGPLAGAEVVVVGGTARATTSDDGSFSLVASAGRTSLAFVHPDLPAWGRPDAPADVRLEAGRTIRVRLATPSPATVLARLCEGRGAVLGGVVRDLLTLVPVSAASVDVRVDTDTGSSSTQTAHASADGSYHLCLAAAAGLEVRARLGSERSRSLSLRAGDGAVALRTLFIPLSKPAEVQGVVRDGRTGRPLDDAAVRIDGTRLGTFTRGDGRFTFRGVPPGDVALSVELIGYGRRVVELRAEGGARVDLTLDLFPEAVALDSMVVSVRGGTVDRVRGGARYDGLDRPAIDKLLPRTLAFDDLLRNANVPGLRIREARKFIGGFESSAPGLCVETGRTSALDAETCQMVEVYLNDVRLADAETVLMTLDPATVDSFRLLSRTEAGVQYGGTTRARNGVLLIYTRGR